MLQLAGAAARCITSDSLSLVVTKKFKIFKKKYFKKQISKKNVYSFVDRRNIRIRSDRQEN